MVTSFYYHSQYALVFRCLGKLGLLLFLILNLTGIANFNYERKNEMNGGGGGDSRTSSSKASMQAIFVT